MSRKPEGRCARISVMVSEKTYTKLKRFASMTHRNISMVTDWGLDEWLEVKEEEIKLNAEKSFTKSYKGRAEIVQISAPATV